ncbi:MAG: TraM recognition domain-containing protein [Alphaproteobacteria bacterium]|nr:TraM recognition domain-containing protein [Alphaproteobacteria bacterium]
MKILGKEIGWRFLGLLLNPKKAHTEAMAWANELTSGSRALNGPHVPQDLREPLDRTIFTASGKKFSGMMLLSDSFVMTQTLFYPLFVMLFNLLLNIALMSGIPQRLVSNGGDMSFMYIPLMVALSMIGITYFLINGLKGFQFKAFIKPFVWIGGVACSAYFSHMKPEAQFFGMLFAFMSPVIYMYLCNETININYARALVDQEFKHSHTLGFTHASFFTDNEKILQIDAAIRDKSKPIIFGTTTGRLRFNGKSNSPVAGNKMIATAYDIQEGHLQVLGKSGFGKTTFIRSVADQLADTDCGMLVVDGKQMLAEELGVKSAENPNGILDEIISVERTKNFAILEGLSPEERAEQILTVTGSANAKKDIWDSAGGLNLYYAGAIQDLIIEMANPAHVKQGVLKHFAESTDKPWSGFSEIYGYDESFITYKNIGVQILETPDPESKSKHQIVQILECHAKYGEVDKKGKPTNRAAYIEQCVSYIKNKGNAGKDKINSSVEFTVDTWNSLLTQSEDLLGWAASVKSDTLVTNVLLGKKIGITIDKKYAKAGVLILRFIIARVLKEIEKRKKGWRKDPNQKQVYFICDEAQDVLTEFIVDKAAITRSLGFAYIISTQTESGLMLKLGKDLKETFKAQFSNKVWYFVDDKESTEALIEACGKTNLIRSSNKSGQPIDFNLSANILSGSAEFDVNHPEAKAMSQLGSMSLLGKFKRNFIQDTLFAFRVAQKNDNDGLMATFFQVGDTPVNVLTHADYEKISNRGFAVVQIKRAGYFRTDVCKMRGIDENGNILE